MKYVEGYASDEVQNCPFCGSDEITNLVQRGEYKCNECGKQYSVIESEW